MAFFTRPDFDERQFKQLTGATITLSGTTNVATGGTLSVDGTFKSKGIEIDAATGGTGNTGHVLTYNSGKIDLQPSTGGGSGGGSNVFDGVRNITRTAVSVGSEIAGTPNTTGITEFLEYYFYPAVAPFNSLTLASANSREFGDALDTGNGGDTLTWNVTINNPTGLTSLVVNGQTFPPLSNTSGETSTGATATYDVVVADYSPTTGTTSTSHQYTMDSNNGLVGDTASTTITWKHKVFWFKSSTKYFVGDDTILEDAMNGVSGDTMLGSALATQETRIFGTIDFSSEYFYYAYPLQFDVPAFTVNGLPNNAWGDAPDTLFVFSYTNAEGYTERYYLASSDNILNTTFDISVA